MNEDSAVIETLPGDPDYITWYELVAVQSDLGDISIRISPDKLEVLLFAIRGTSEKTFTVNYIVKLLKDNGIVANIDEPSIYDNLVNFTKVGARIVALVVARGVEAINGQDAYIEYLFDRQNPKVEKSQELIRIHEVLEGRTGQDVFGDCIEYVDGKNLDLKLLGGVELIDNQFFAEIDGYAVVGFGTIVVSDIFKLVITSDNYNAEISFDDKSITAQHLLNFLKSLGIESGLRSDVVDSIIGAGKADSIIIAEGIEPVDAVDAKLDFFYKRSGGALKQGVDGKIDYKNQSSYVMVNPDQKILRLKPAISGRNGVDIYGIISEVKEPKHIKINAGDNVTIIDEDGALVFIADARGTPVLKNNILNVCIDLDIEGDLGLATGNIIFEGNINIAGHILDGFEVHTKKNIITNGTVGSANLSAEGNIEVLSGFKGKKNSKIICGGDLKAKYIDDLTAEVEGNIVSEAEIVGCRIFNRGFIKSPTAVLVGGEITCLGGIHILSLGSDAYVRTSLLVGEDYKLLRFKDEWQPKLVILEAEESEIAEKLSSIKRNPQILKRMSTSLKLKFKNMLLRLKDIQNLKEQYNKELAALQSEALDKKNAEIRVEKMLYPGTFIRIGFSEQEIKSEMQGPLLITEDLENQMISIKAIS